MTDTTSSPATVELATPNVHASSGDDLTGGQARGDTQMKYAPGVLGSEADVGAQSMQDAPPADLLTEGQGKPEARCASAPGDLLGSEAAVHPNPIVEAPPAEHPGSPGTAEGPSEPATGAPSGWVELRMWAEMFHDTQQARIACTNRAERGGVDPDLFAPQIDALKRAEHEIRKGMVACYRRDVPETIRAWQDASRGIGESTLARLLGAIGHPTHATPYHWEGEGTDRTLIADEPYDRTVSQLWAYCGHGDPARKRRKGMTAEDAAALGKPHAKTLVFLLAEACVKAGGPYRVIYDQRRAVTDRTHPDWSKGHAHADAMRIMGKEILRDLWLAAHGSPPTAGTPAAPMFAPPSGDRTLMAVPG